MATDNVPPARSKEHQTSLESQQQAPHSQNVKQTQREFKYCDRFLQSHSMSISISGEDGTMLAVASCDGRQSQRHSCSISGGCSDCRGAIADNPGALSMATASKGSARKLLDSNSLRNGSMSNTCCRRPEHLLAHNHHLVSHHFKTNHRHFMLLHHFFSGLFLLLSLLTLARADATNRHHTEQSQYPQTSPFTWTIADVVPEAHGNNQVGSSGIPDVAATVGRLFWYQIPEKTFGTHSVESYLVSLPNVIIIVYANAVSVDSM